MKHSSAPVLVVEDDQFLRDMIVDTLEANDVRTATARDGKEALKYLQSSSPSSVILDLLLPGADGFAVLEHIQKQGSKIPVTVLTNLSDAGNRKRCKDAGCKAFLIKSDLDAENLWPTLRRYL